MRTSKDGSKRGRFRIGRSLGGIVASACLWPAVAAAQSWNPTASDGRYNTAAGSLALVGHNGTGTGNVATGWSALRNNSDGSYNTAGGYGALWSNLGGSHNTATGAYALYFDTGSDNTAGGFQALFNNDTGTGNTATGLNALYSNTSGYYNTSTGLNALFHNVGGAYNTANGLDALFSNVSGNYNTAVGGAALYAGTGSENTAVGYQALRFDTTGADNTAVGVNALYSTTTGKQNTGLGVTALFASTTGFNNVAVGYGALRALTGNGSGNIALGTAAGSALKGGSNDIYIGNGGTNESNVTRIGTVQTKVFVAGIKGVPLSGATVVVDSSGQLGVVASSARYKQDIRSLGRATGDVEEKLARLRPVSYRYKVDPGAIHYGLIAEEVDRVMPELVVRDAEGRPDSVQYLELIPLLLRERQELWAEHQDMKAELARQRALVEEQAATLAALRRSLDIRLATLRRDGTGTGP